MAKPTKAGGEKPETDGTKFREGYYKHHKLNEGRFCTNEENKACMKVVLDVLNKRITEPEGQKRIQEILNPVHPHW